MAEHDSADVLIVGAGAAGGVVARRLAEAGVRVVCLEQGEWTDRTSYPGAGDDAELRAGRQWSYSPVLRAAPADYPIDVSASDIGIVNYNGVGGGTVLYNAQWPRMLPDDLRVRSVDGVADDWPLTYAELQPFYEEADRQFGVSGLGGNPAYPPGADPPLPPMPIGTLGERVARAHAALGWHWWPATNAIASAAIGGRHVCVQRGTCGSGCNEGAKGSTDVTHWPAAIAAGARLVTGATVHRIELDARGLACGAVWVDGEGVERFTAADVVVLAANGIGTPRLLLASTSARFPDGLANRSGLVGRRLMLHPLVGVSGLFDGPADGWKAHNGALIHSLQFAGSDASRGFRRGATWALGTAGGPLRHAFAPDGRGVWGSAHHRHVAERLGRTASWVLICEDLPDDTNRVELSSDRTDRTGLPAARIVYSLGENSRRLMDWHAARARESLLAAGAWKVEVAMHPANGHLMGTARMGDDPATSVVDLWGAAHDVGNLLVVDGSVFVTAGSANPTSTIAALALRAADHLIALRRAMPRPEHARSESLVSTVAVRTTRSPVTAVDDGLSSTTARDVDRRALAALADELIPAADGMPSATDVGVHDHLLDRVVAARPDLHPGLVASLAALQLDPGDAAARAKVAYVVAGAYYLSPLVRELLQYQTTDPAPVRADAFPAYIAEGLLDHVLPE
jgi:choline dehydrogenase-like flavoprotein